jgi:hypothetical protein
MSLLDPTRCAILFRGLRFGPGLPLAVRLPLPAEDEAGPAPGTALVARHHAGASSPLVVRRLPCLLAGQSPLVDSTEWRKLLRPSEDLPSSQPGRVFDTRQREALVDCTIHICRLTGRAAARAPYDPLNRPAAAPAGPATPCRHGYRAFV